MTEAMSLGKPVVVGARGTSGFREQVIPNGEGICGYHINPYDPQDIAKFVVNILKHPDLAATMGKNGGTGNRTVHLGKRCGKHSANLPGTGRRLTRGFSAWCFNGHGRSRYPERSFARISYDRAHAYCSSSAGAGTRRYHGLF